MRMFKEAPLEQSQKHLNLRSTATTTGEYGTPCTNRRAWLAWSYSNPEHDELAMSKALSCSTARPAQGLSSHHSQMHTSQAIHRFFIISDNRFLPAGVRWSRFFLV